MYFETGTTAEKTKKQNIYCFHFLVSLSLPNNLMLHSTKLFECTDLTIPMKFLYNSGSIIIENISMRDSPLEK
jgi:hypothetical protein